MELIKLENDVALLDADVQQTIINMELAIKDLKEREEELKRTILNEMEEKNIIKVESDNLLINYIASTDRETFNTKVFREEQPDLYDEYVKLTPVKPSIRIKVK